MLGTTRGSTGVLMTTGLVFGRGISATGQESGKFNFGTGVAARGNSATGQESGNFNSGRRISVGCLIDWNRFCQASLRALVSSHSSISGLAFFFGFSGRGWTGSNSSSAAAIWNSGFGSSGGLMRTGSGGTTGSIAGVGGGNSCTIRRFRKRIEPSREGSNRTLPPASSKRSVMCSWQVNMITW